MKRRFYLIIPFITLLLSSCSFNSPSITSLSPSQSDTSENYKKVTNFTYSLSDVNASVGMYNLPSKGESKILVVPVQAKDGKSWTEEMLQNTNLAFFGESSQTGWQSVSSFYYESSYHRLSISGEVASPFTSKLTVAELAKNKSGGSCRPDIPILEEFEASEDYDTLRAKYDVDKNGYIDSVIFVYSNQIDYDKGYWAWVYWGSSYPSVEIPTVNSYMWVSYNFIQGSQKSGKYPYAAYGDKVDGHTVIHETGHLLGLDDYYCYDDDSDAWDPSGALEMQSYNVGDQNIYSKMALGWVDPYYVKIKNDNPVKLTLRSSSAYGDAIILNDNWNGSSCDEYLIIEYYTPNGLNYTDSVTTYAGNGCRMYTKCGFRIYHIDARTVKINSRGIMEKYVDSLNDSDYFATGASNSKSLSYLNEGAGDYKLCHLLEAGGINTFKKQKGIASNETLFTTGQSFVASKEFFTNGANWNDNSVVGYKLTIDDCQSSYGTITITKI